MTQVTSGGPFTFKVPHVNGWRHLVSEFSIVGLIGGCRSKSRGLERIPVVAEQDHMQRDVKGTRIQQAIGTQTLPFFYLSVGAAAQGQRGCAQKACRGIRTTACKTKESLAMTSIDASARTNIHCSPCQERFQCLQAWTYVQFCLQQQRSLLYRSMWSSTSTRCYNASRTSLMYSVYTRNRGREYLRALRSSGVIMFS
jgi:hypothetical protein